MLPLAHQPEATGAQVRIPDDGDASVVLPAEALPLEGVHPDLNDRGAAAFGVYVEGALDGGQVLGLAAHAILPV